MLCLATASLMISPPSLGFLPLFSMKVGISYGAVFGAFVVVVTVAIATVVLSPSLLALNSISVSTGLIMNTLLSPGMNFSQSFLHRNVLFIQETIARRWQGC